VVGDLDGAAVERAVAEHDAVGRITDITDVEAWLRSSTSRCRRTAAPTSS
jgi:hypothetical protein